MQPIVYLTIEMLSREFDSRLLMAAHAVEAGMTVVVGQQWALFNNLTALPRGILLVKTVNAIQARVMAAAKAAGHAVAAMDEEVLAMANAEGFLKAFSPIAATACDLFLAQSEPHQAAIEASYPEMKGRIAATGNPRIDLMSPKLRVKFEDEARKLREETGPFILFNTNYSITNSIWGDVNNVAAIAVNAGVLDPKQQDTVVDFQKNIEFEQTNRQALGEILNWVVAKLPTHKAVIRPHPAETPDFWQKAVNNHPRVRVVPRSNHIPWILASDLVVHTSCTTGLEAAIMGKKAVNLSPNPDSPWYKLYVMGKVNPVFRDMRLAAQAIAQYFQNGGGPIAEREPYQQQIEHYFPNIQAVDASARMAQAFKATLAARGANVDSGFKWEGLPAGYKKIERGALLKDKMTASLQQVRETLDYLRGIDDLKRPFALSEIDDSLFLLSPG
jgi:surface carbohydrate biosynthesis protein